MGPQVDTTKLRLETTKARRDVRALMRKASGGGNRRAAPSRTLNPARGRVVQTLAALGGFRGAMSLLRARGHDPWVEALAPFENQIHEAIDGALGWNARAMREARNDTAKTFALQVARGAGFADARRFFDRQREIRHAQERGRQIVRRNVHGPDPLELAKQALPGFLRLLQKSVNYVVHALGG